MSQNLPRVTMYIFATSAPTGDVEEFGSTASGHSTTTKDISIIMSGSFSQWVNGWVSAVVGADNPYLESMNALGLVLSQQLCYLFGEGIPNWDAGTTYNIGSLAKTPYTGATNQAIYMSLTDSNFNNALPNLADNANWRYVSGNRKKVGQFTSASGTGNQAITGVGFKPRLVQFFLNITNGGTSLITTQGAMDSNGGQWLIMSTAGTSYSASNSTTACVGIQALSSASFVSMDADGFTINWTSIISGIIFSYVAYE